MAISSAVQELLTGLSSLELESYPYEHARALMNAAHANGVQLDIVIVRINRGQIIGRIRPNKKGQRFKLKTDLSYPPAQLVTKLQRASNKDQTMFYGCVEHPVTTEYTYADQDNRVACAKEYFKWFREDQLKDIKYQLVTYSRWRVIEPIEVVGVVLAKQFYNNNLLTQELVNAFRQHVQQYPHRKDDTLAISEYFAEHFSNPDADGDRSYLYTMSALFTAMVLMNGHDGVMYPSVRANGFTQNVALTPQTADNKLSLISATELSLYRYKSHWAIDNEFGCGIKPNQASFEITNLPSADDHAGIDKIFKELNCFQRLYYKLFIKKSFKK